MNQAKTISCILCILFLLPNLFAQNYSGKKKDIEKILQNIESFSSFYVNAEYRKLAECYTSDGKIFPGGADIIEGIDAIEKRWILPEGTKVLRHKVSPIEIKVIKKYAYDYGYYEGESRKENGEQFAFKGKYVIVWKKQGKDWKIFLDIWNRI